MGTERRYWYKVKTSYSLCTICKEMRIESMSHPHPFRRFIIIDEDPFPIRIMCMESM